MKPTEWIDYAGQRAVRMAGPAATLVVLPEIGGKIASLRANGDGGELLWQDPTRPYRPITYGGRFEDFDTSGFDECFPTIEECAYPDYPWAGVTAPDHGELWCQPWDCAIVDPAVHLSVHGVRFPYRFEKQIAATERGFTLAYRLTNLSPFAFQYVWLAHPLLAVEEGSRILVPGAPVARLAFATGDRVRQTPFEPFEWPWIPGPEGQLVDYSRIGPRSLGATDKVYVETADPGWCALYHPSSGQYVGFRMARSAAPYVGFCLNHGGWPFTPPQAYWAALEPCTGYPDPLDEIVRRGLHRTLAPRESAAWSLELVVGQAGVAEEAAAEMAAG